MVKAKESDRNLVVNILADSFIDNLSVQYILKKGTNNNKSVKALMEYSFDMCMLFGEVFLSEDRNACALIMFPEQKTDNLKSIFLDIKLIINSTGIRNVKKVLTREKLIKEKHPTKRMYYLWFIGVHKSEQKKGLGSKLLQEVIQRASIKNLDVFLETSTSENIPWYRKFGFKEYSSIEIGYKLYFFSNAKI